MCLTVITPDRYHAEKRYLFDHIFKRRFGLTYAMVFQRNVDSTECHLPNKKIIQVSDVFFSASRELWLTAAHLPKLPLQHWDVLTSPLSAATLCLPSIPILFPDHREKKAKFTFNQEGGKFSFDLFGAVFFLLSRYEEKIVQQSDEHGRFPASVSTAYAARFLDRPLADEYMELLWTAFSLLCPRLKRLPTQFRIVPTHDIDHYKWTSSFSPAQLIHHTAYLALKQRNIKKASLFAIASFLSKIKRSAQDPFYVYSLIMDAVESVGEKSLFFFLSNKTACPFDGSYNLHHRWLRRQLREIAERGHEIAWHPSYQTVYSSTLLESEWKQFKKICKEEGIASESIGSRQHYLRWNNAQSFAKLEKLGVAYDSTLYFAQHVGFRCGTCHPFHPFNWKEKQSFKIIERPLVVMDGTLLAAKYMNLSYNIQKARDWIGLLQERCRRMKGEFVFLWHNSQLYLPKQWELFWLCLGQQKESSYGKHCAFSSLFF